MATDGHCVKTEKACSVVIGGAPEIVHILSPRTMCSSFTRFFNTWGVFVNARSSPIGFALEVGVDFATGDAFATGDGGGVLSGILPPR